MQCVVMIRPNSMDVGPWNLTVIECCVLLLGYIGWTSHAVGELVLPGWDPSVGCIATVKHDETEWYFNWMRDCGTKSLDLP